MRVRNKVTFLIAGLAIILSACSTYRIVNPERVSIDGVYTVKPTVAWNKRTTGLPSKVEIWNIDGNLLQELYFMKGFSDGDKLFVSQFGSAKENYPEYKSGMSPLEFKEYFEASVGQKGVLNLEVKQFRPTNFGQTKGFRFEFNYASKDGLKRKGFLVAANINDDLYGIFYTAPELYFYDAFKPQAEAIINSIELNQPTKVSHLKN